MNLNLTVTSPAILDANNILTAIISFNDPRSNQQNQRADVVINCAEIFDFCVHAPRVAFDFFFIASCAYGIDRLIERRPYSVDGWSRELNISLPVMDTGAWLGREDQVSGLLSFLTGDYWNVKFTKSPLSLPSNKKIPLIHSQVDHINLFSGGLDSLIGAIDFLTRYPKEKLLLISHYDPNMHGPKSDQDKLYRLLSTHFRQPVAWSNSVGVFLENASQPTRENTLRSRSLLFIGLAVLAASASGNAVPIWVPENGSVSLNYPLSASRRTACSTRTTHPRLLNDIRILLDGLGLSSDIRNPYELYTKGMMVAKCADQSFLLSIIDQSNSCGKRGHRNGWIRMNASHCGVCMPCVYRRAALTGVIDTTTYGTNLEELDRDSTTGRFPTKRGQDMDACLEFLNAPLTLREIKSELIINGVNDLDHLSDYANVVQATRQELKDWVSLSPVQRIRAKAGLA
jgi:7-cyano-7-deazaguanine synthase in queuosine biosynthesis